MRPFDLLSSKTKEVLLKLEERDAQERIDETEGSIRLRQIPRESGEFLYQFLTIHASRFDLLGIEIGSSGGYSTIWQALALESNGQGTLISLEIDPIKVKLAEKNLKNADITQFAIVIQTDAKRYLKNLPRTHLHYVFLDAEKEDYLDYYKLISPHMRSGSVMIADNMLSHEEDMTEFLNVIYQDTRVSGLVLPVGKGLALVRWL